MRNWEKPLLEDSRAFCRSIRGRSYLCQYCLTIFEFQNWCPLRNWRWEVFQRLDFLRELKDFRYLKIKYNLFSISNIFSKLILAQKIIKQTWFQPIILCQKFGIFNFLCILKLNLQEDPCLSTSHKFLFLKKFEK